MSLCIPSYTTATESSYQCLPLLTVSLISRSMKADMIITQFRFDLGCTIIFLVLYLRRPQQDFIKHEEHFYWVHSYGPHKGKRILIVFSDPIAYKLIMIMMVCVCFQAKIVLDMVVTMFSEYCEEPFTWVPHTHTCSVNTWIHLEMVVYFCICII